MPRFSERNGLVPVRLIIQKDSIDTALKNRLWNALRELFLDRLPEKHEEYLEYAHLFINVRIWLGYFKHRHDHMPRDRDDFIDYLDDYFFKKAEWFEVYDFVEFLARNYVPEERSDNRSEIFIKICNLTFKQEMSGYRFVGNIITPITSEEEILSVEKVLNIEDKYRPVKAQLRRALELLSDKTSPDYRNSIKDSINAVEAYCCLLTGKTNATLGDALKEMEKKHNLHGALKGAFDKLYGYTSDAEGIRHKLMDESTLGQEDAVFMLVTCSAFINYSIAKNN